MADPSLLLLPLPPRFPLPPPPVSSFTVVDTTYSNLTKRSSFFAHFHPSPSSLLCSSFWATTPTMALPKKAKTVTGWWGGGGGELWEVLQRFFFPPLSSSTYMKPPQFWTSWRLFRHQRKYRQCEIYPHIEMLLHRTEASDKLHWDFTVSAKG